MLNNVSGISSDADGDCGSDGDGSSDGDGGSDGDCIGPWLGR